VVHTAYAQHLEFFEDQIFPKTKSRVPSDDADAGTAVRRLQQRKPL